jgi:hypothetical protein
LLGSFNLITIIGSWRFGSTRFDNRVGHCLPSKQISAKIGVGVIVGANLGSEEDLESVGGKNFPGQSIPYTLRDTNNVANSLAGIGRVVGFDHFVIHLLPKEEPEEYTDVNGNASEEGKGNGTCGVVVHTVEEEANTLKAKEPSVGRSSCAVHGAVCCALDCVVPSFGWVLLLLMGFTLPSGNK